MTDVIGAVKDYLENEGTVTALLDSDTTRIYGGEILRADIDEMPRGAVVLSPAGGGLIGNAYQDYGDVRVDVDCYGATPYEAYTLYLAVYASLKHLRRSIAGDQVLLHWARASSKGTEARDPETDWPVVTSSWQVLAAEVTPA